uniref:Reverse transcriptase domain-containing protein n=1 Tax=Schizaphis graminum TaxID=13262 RepID=A0A2S2P488_SCHGA
MPKGKFSRGKKPVFWWSQDIANLRAICLAARRKYKRCRNNETLGQREIKHLEYKEARKKLKREIKKSKKASWDNLCNQVETDSWGLPYKIVTKKLMGRRAIPGLTLPGRLESIVDTLFPREAITKWPPRFSEQFFPEVNMAEVTEAISKIPLGKAPGPDGIPDMVIKEIAARKPQTLCRIFNLCLKHGSFPKTWKTAKLVLLRKGDKPLEQPSSYRPICLLNTVGKLFERIIKRRLETYLESIGGLSERQYGFRKGRSTIDAITKVSEIGKQAAEGPWRRRRLCAVVALDVANAFNSARWDKIETALCRKGVPEYLLEIIRNYLCNRAVEFGEKGRRTVTCGVPQGSVLGPLLWNVMYDDLLRADFGESTRSSSSELVAFADDVAVVATGLTTPIIEKTMNTILERVANWMDANGLKLSIQKTEAIMQTSKRGYENPIFVIRGVPIQLKEQMRYLGVQLSRALGYKKHLETIAAKASSTSSALSRLMPNVGGSRQRKRQLLATVVNSQLLYAAPVWAGALVYLTNIRIIQRPQRAIALRAASAYRTVSTAAIMVVSGIIPVHLLARERQKIYMKRTEPGQKEIKAIEREETYKIWQEEWEAAETGRWTWRLIKEVKQWSTRKFGQVDYHLTQVLTGHGGFGQYLHRFKKREDPRCVDCQIDVDDAEHTIFHCDRWWRQRRELEVRIGGVFEPDKMIGYMIKNESNWDLVKRYCHQVLSKREEEERERQLLFN